MRRYLVLRALLVLFCVALPFAEGKAQSTSPPAFSFLVIDQDRLYLDSAFGKRALAELEEDSLALAEENRRIEDALIAEEQTITERRPTVTQDEFRALADDFDRRVTDIRAAQDRKIRSLNSRDDEERRRFFEAVVPILGGLLQEAGASALLDRRSVLLSDDRLDITDRAIVAIDEAIGDGIERTLETAPAPTTDSSEP